VTLADAVLYGIFAALLLATAYKMTRGFDFGKNRLDYVNACLFLYALLMPRFKNYSYIILIIPSLYAISKKLSSRTAKLIAIAAVCLPSTPTYLFEYKALFTALGLFLVYLRSLRQEHAQSTRPSSAPVS